MAAAAEQAPQQRQTPSCALLLDHGGDHHHAQTAPCCASRSRDTARRETGVFPNAPKKRRFVPDWARDGPEIAGELVLEPPVARGAPVPRDAAVDDAPRFALPRLMRSAPF